jgi:hypothetical protein
VIGVFLFGANHPQDAWGAALAYAAGLWSGGNLEATCRYRIQSLGMLAKVQAVISSAMGVTDTT